MTEYEYIILTTLERISLANKILSKITPELTKEAFDASRINEAKCILAFYETKLFEQLDPGAPDEVTPYDKPSIFDFEQCHKRVEELMVLYGPDGHCDEADKIVQYFQAIIEGNEEEFLKYHKLK